MGSPDCTSISLKLPPLQPSGAGSCDGADAMIVQMKAGSRAYWEKAEALTTPLDAAKVEPGRAGTVLTVRADPTMVYQFRALARNSAGISAPGAASPPTMVNRFYAALLEPPKPTATSSASYTVSWGATLGACQPDVRWDLLYSRIVDDDWHSIAENVATESVELPALRCADGCVFKARARAVEGFSGYSKNSAPLPTKPLPQARAGAIRLEVRLESPGSGSSGGDDPSERSDDAIARGLARLAEVPEKEEKEAVSIVERRCVLDDGACFFVFDLWLQPGDTARAIGAARNLARALQGRDAKGGGAAEALRDVDLQYGLRLVSQDDDVTQRIEPSVSTLATLWSVAAGVTRLASRSPMAVLSLVAALGLACCAYCCCRLCLRARFHTHSKIRQDDDDDDDDDDAWPEDAHADGASEHWRDDIHGGRCDKASPKVSSASANTRREEGGEVEPTYQI